MGTGWERIKVKGWEVHLQENGRKVEEVWWSQGASRDSKKQKMAWDKGHKYLIKQIKIKWETRTIKSRVRTRAFLGFKRPRRSSQIQEIVERKWVS